MVKTNYGVVYGNYGVSLIKKRLHEQLGKTLGERYQVHNLGPHGQAQYALTLPVEHIEIDF